MTPTLVCSIAIYHICIYYYSFLAYAIPYILYAVFNVIAAGRVLSVSTIFVQPRSCQGELE